MTMMNQTVTKLPAKPIIIPKRSTSIVIVVKPDGSFNIKQNTSQANSRENAKQKIKTLIRE